MDAYKTGGRNVQKTNALLLQRLSFFVNAAKALRHNKERFSFINTKLKKISNLGSLKILFLFKSSISSDYR